MERWKKDRRLVMLKPIIAILVMSFMLNLYALQISDQRDPEIFSLKKQHQNILSKIKDREEAKKAGDYKLADLIRDDLNKEGIDIKDEKGKTTWNYK